MGLNDSKRNTWKFLIECKRTQPSLFENSFYWIRTIPGVPICTLLTNQTPARNWKFLMAANNIQPSQYECMQGKVVSNAHTEIRAGRNLLVALSHYWAKHWSNFWNIGFQLAHRWEMDYMLPCFHPEWLEGASFWVRLVNKWCGNLLRHKLKLVLLSSISWARPGKLYCLSRCKAKVRIYWNDNNWETMRTLRVPYQIWVSVYYVMHVLGHK